MSEIKLKPCPTCGSVAKSTFGGMSRRLKRFVKCTNVDCGVQGPGITHIGDITDESVHEARVESDRLWNEMPRKMEAGIDVGDIYLPKGD